ncbi:zinc-ribbon domain-containing protein [Candidatus Stoquefichus massiliensis]|uniref:zinc-ribbon domain-containing protein n=1 Tax=Candidatus Stoquefichus massiliensis TaxID=1470350 RepID=UPI0004834366|nr:zinc ribbon domain-containing protein [Candidatus Stoquefichus massiliensis]
MKECPYCHKDLPDDSTFCTYCGKPLQKVSMQDLEKAKEKLEKERENQKIDPSLKHNPRQNSWSKLGLMLFLISLIGLDFIVGSIVGTLGMNTRFVFIISMIGYIGAIGCGVMSFVIDHQDKKRGFQPNGNSKFAMVAIIMSGYIALLNLSTVILK